MLFKVSVVVAIHIVIFISYNETGEFARYYLPISVILWTGFLLFLNFGLKILKFINKYLAYVVYAAIYFLMCLTICFTMPQKDRITVFEKISSGQFPNAKTLKRGIRKLGFKVENIPVKKLKKINRNIGKTLNKLEEKARAKGEK